MKIFSGTSNKQLAQNLAKNLGVTLSSLEVFIFPDGEKRIRILDKVLGVDVYVVQSTSSPTDENYMELFFIIDGLKRSGAKSITAIVPYFGYQRQDRQFREGEAVSVKVIAEILEQLGINKLISVDMHSIKIEEAFNIPVVHLSALSIFAKFIKEKGWNKNSTLVSPDMGGIRRIKLMSEMLNNMPYVVIEKNRDLSSGKVSAEKIQGEIKEKVIIVDDMISSGKTIEAAVSLLKKQGVLQILVLAVHPVFSDEAPILLQNLPIEKVVVSDTIEVPKEKQFQKLEVLSVAGMIAEVL